MLINILITIVGLFALIALESFFINLFSFSVLIIVLLVLIDKLDWKYWVLIATLATVLVDILLLKAIGVTLLVTTVSTVILYILFLLMPKKQVALSYIPYFFAFLNYYVLLDLVAPFLQDGVWGSLTSSGILYDVVRSIISTAIIFLVNIIIDNFRAQDTLRL